MSPETAVAWSEGKAAICPKCNSEVSYHLGDGRRMCKDCRTKYTVSRRPGRLPDKIVLELARHFWLMSPLDRAAEALGVNRKTVSRYYMVMRNLIANHGEAKARPRLMRPSVDAFVVGRYRPLDVGVNLTDTVTVFCLLWDGRQIRLIFTRPWRDWSGLELASLQARRLEDGQNSDEPESGEALEAAFDFVGFAQQRLARYRGGFMKDLPLFLREMEYRYNHHRDDLVVQRLQTLLRNGPQ